jgi:hypothetical protein
MLRAAYELGSGGTTGRASAHSAAIVVGRYAERARLASVGCAVLHHAHCPVFITG